MNMNIVNVTPHPITFMNPDTKEIFEIQPSGVLINARVVEAKIATNGEVELVKTAFVSSEEEEEKLSKLESAHPNAFIVGSIIAAQAFPGRVLAMTPCPGYERVAPAEKRMNLFKFITF